MYKVFRTNSFKKDYKKISNENKKLVKNIVLQLSKANKLDDKYKDHLLIGNFKNCRECHIKPDLLLIYKINNDILELALLRVGKHSSLF